jgi:hypothetical protein
VEIETLKAQAEVEPLSQVAAQLGELKASGGTGALHAYVRNLKMGLLAKASQVLLEVRK